MFEERTYKRCYCVGPVYHRRGPKKGQPMLNDDGSQKIASLNSACPKLEQRGHGVWYYWLLLSVPGAAKPIRFHRGGFRTQAKAAEECKKTWEQHNAGLDVTTKETVAEWLQRWIDNKKDVAPTTIEKYAEHIRLHIVPFIGHIDRKDLRKHHLEEMFKGINDRNITAQIHREYVTLLAADCEEKRRRWRDGAKADRAVLRSSWYEARELLASEKKKLRRVTDVQTQYKVRATLSSALQDAFEAEEVTKNWAQLIKISKRQVKPLLWTAARVARWRETGEIPGKVMVWTPELTGQFLDKHSADELYDLWHFLAFRGPRRGEACALPWTEVDFEAMTVNISRQVITVANELVGAEPKAGSERVLDLDSEGVQNFTGRRTRQLAHRLKAGAAWVDTGLVWTQENGEGYHPDFLTRRFKRLVELADLPPITLHGLRHGAACIAHRSGAKPKAVQEQLGHASYQITMDTYTSIFREEQRELAEAALNVVPRAGRPATIPAPVPAPAPAEAPEVRSPGGGRLTALRRARQRKAGNPEATA
ncbi:tyrosine-type recombinase/integrase [Kitasatospora cineracea]|uniref:tyrosine-type recombinase/integrase n=1 Tax=Kitasatospora cineracea TaxID=88074 RepID=UPI0033E53E64